MDDIISISKIEPITVTKKKKMPEELLRKVDLFTPMQKRYADYRAKGMRQADAAVKAGSTANGRSALGRVGYNWEQLDGMKEYIAFLFEQRAQAAVLDEIELIEKLRENYEEAIRLERVDWANKSLELMGMMINAFKSGPYQAAKETSGNGKTKNNVNAFKPEGEVVPVEKRLESIHGLLKTMNIGKEAKTSKE